MITTAKELLQNLHNNRAVRLIGVRVDKLSSKEERQMSLFEVQENKKQENLDKAIDEIKKKYGYEMVTRAGEMKVKNMLNIRDEKGE